MAKRTIDDSVKVDAAIMCAESLAQDLAHMADELRKGNIPSDVAYNLQRACIMLARDSAQLACSLGLSVRQGKS